jgi:NADH-quinone oxidoreductase subunit J
MQIAFFLFFAIAALLGALSVILQKNPIYSALSLIVVIASLGGLFLLLNANFIAVLQIVIYAGAIMTLFLFVIMMTEPRVELRPLWNFQSRAALLILLLIAGVTIWSVSSSESQITTLATNFNVKALGRMLFTSYLFPFEIISILIISSVIGALYIARKEEA